MFVHMFGLHRIFAAAHIIYTSINYCVRIYNYFKGAHDDEEDGKRQVFRYADF